MNWLTGIGNLLLGVVAVLSYLNRQQSKTNANKLDEVHGLVNQQLTDSVNRRDVAEARTKVLEDEAKPIPGTSDA